VARRTLLMVVEACAAHLFFFSGASLNKKSEVRSMFKLGFRSLCCAVALSCASAPLLAGCSHAEQGEAVEDGGSLDLALTTTGADGAVYGFPDQTYLEVSTATFSEWIPLWTSTETLLSKTLPAGAYTATLIFQNGTPELTRTEGMTTTTVGAEWTNPQPVSLTVVKGQTTPLALHFSVDSLVDLVFDTGTLNVIADVVEEDAEQPQSATVSGTTNIDYEVYGDSTATYATALDVDSGVDLAFAMGFHANGAWQQYGSSSVCQPGTLVSGSSSGSAGLDLRLRQLIDGQAYLCVNELGASDQISLFPSNYGLPPMGQETFLPGAAYSFYGGFYAYVGDIYDGTTLAQTDMENLVLTNAYFYHQIYDDGGQQVSTVQGAISGTFQLRP
jgi:hypothetical protein